ncbi:MAG: Ig-like domain-containing protein [Acidimicrobiia bacterium]|nr:Ig-like domain-containing protein [Acidimicrobiia bacterium]
MAAALFVALTVGLVAHVLHVGHHAVAMNGLFHWLRDALLAVPLALAVVCVVNRRVRSWTLARGSLARVRWALMVGLGYAAVLIPGGLAHALLFPAEHHSGAPLPHAVSDALALLPTSLSAALGFALLFGIPAERTVPLLSVLRGIRAMSIPARTGQAIVARTIVAIVASISLIPTPSLAAEPATAAPLTDHVPTIGEGCNRQIYADVVALDQIIVYNRLGAVNPNGLMYALRRDVVHKDGANAGQTEAESGVPLEEGNVMLREDKRPRPLVLRANVGDCITVDFENLIDPVPAGQACPPEVVAPNSWDNQPHGDWPCDRHVGMHVTDMQLVDDIQSDGAYVGENDLTGTDGDKSIVAPGESTTYEWFAEYENTFLLYNQAVTVGSEGSGGTAGVGLFGALNVEPVQSVWYRSQLTREEMDWATPAELFTDTNENGVWDDAVPADTYEDSNGNGVWDDAVPADTYTDSNANGVWDPAEPLLTDVNGNGVWDPEDTYTDSNGNGVWDPAEPLLTDENGNGVWDDAVPAEPLLTDENDNGAWDDAIPAEPLTDTNGDGVWNAHRTTPGGQPIIDYAAVYPTEAGDAKVGLPIIAMLNGSELVHSDINAIISGPASNGYKIPKEAYTPGYWENANYPGGDDPFREYTVIFQDEAFGVQAFPQFSQSAFEHALHGVADAFPINYGSGGIGSEIIANRLGLGPMANCTECKYEEFFLTSWAVGDPAMIVDVPASVNVNPDGTVAANPVRATKALYPDDPSNVHHSYLNDRVKFRNLHAGPKEHHIFHLHAHQWQFDWNDEGSNYLDSQGMGPGSGFTYEIAYGGSGNRNKTAGDSIFHCHFYPHFAQGMWELWRVHDTFERGTELTVDDPGTIGVDEGGRPVDGARALPDGEIVEGTPIPAVVPLPSLPMAPSPAVTDTLKTDWNNPADPFDISTSQIDLDGDGNPDVLEAPADVDMDLNGDGNIDAADNPGYPFFIPGLTGHRPPTPALDIVDIDNDGKLEDGGLPRHILTTGPNLNPAAGDVTHVQFQTPVDFNKIIENAGFGAVPEEGTPAEQVAMAFHEARWHDTYLPDGTAVNAGSTVLRRIDEDGDVGPQGGEPSINLQGFETNGLAPKPGAPYADPCRTDPALNSGDISLVDKTRRYKGANIEMDMTLNKVGWHFQQQRFEALWEDVDDILTGAKAPEPLVMRLNPTECAEFWHTNLVPNVYQLDDFQVRTPTDIIGQHIHLVKFDVTSADGSANGWNYEDGTLSPQEVEERVHAIHENVETNPALECGEDFNDADHDGRLDPGDNATPACPLAKKHPFFGEGAMGAAVGDLAWGARTTVQRWYADPLLSQSWDRGLGTVFTHDHYGPSTHQQVGLYSTVLIEPVASQWRDPETGTMFGGVLDENTDALYAPGGWENSDKGLKRLTPDVGAGALPRQDGGPTSWRADILVPDWQGGGLWNVFGENSHREWFMEFADFQHAYEAGRGEPTTCNAKDPADPGRTIPCYADFFGSVNPSIRQEPPKDRMPDLVFFPERCFDEGDGTAGSLRPCPEAISADDPGTYVVNYRNEPLGLRIFEDADLDAVLDPGEDTDGDGVLGQVAGDAGDLARAFQTRTDRAIPQLNTVYGDLPWAAPPGVHAGDPATPLLRAYEGDKVRVRIQTGAHEEEHNMMIHGLKWRREFDSANSGWRNSQFMGISEYFNLELPVSLDVGPGNPAEVDYLWTAGAHKDDLWNGLWGILRAYSRERADLLALPNNPVDADGPSITNIDDFTPPGPGKKKIQPRICPNTAPDVMFRVTAVRAQDIGLTDGIVYNSRLTDNGQGVGPLVDPTAIMYVLNDDLEYDAAGKPIGLKAGVPVEPLILRANAGDCIKIELHNALEAAPVNGDPLNGFVGQPDMPGFASLPSIVTKAKNVDHNGVTGMTTFNANDLAPSSLVGLHTQLLAYNVRQGDGFQTGVNSGDLENMQLVAPGSIRAYTWYAGDIGVVNNGNGSVTLVPTPVEFGVVNLMPADRIKGSNKGMVGALVIEPQGATWVVDNDSRASATVTHEWADGTTTSFRDFVVVLQNDINLRYGGGCVEDPVAGPSGGEFAVPELMDCAVPNIAAEGPGTPEDPQDSAQKAINYGAEPMWYRLGIPPNTGFSDAALRDNQNNHLLYSNNMPGVGEDPQTPVFFVSTEPTDVDVDGDGAADAMQFRMRVAMPGGNARGMVWTVNGHAWQQAPYVGGSARIGDDFRTHNALDLSAGGHNTDRHNMQTWWLGSQEGVGAGSHFDFVPRKTGGKFAVEGDYLFRDVGSFGNYQGLWGILRFAAPPDPPANSAPVALPDGPYQVTARTGGPVVTELPGPEEVGLLFNDSDPDGDPLTAVRVSNAQHGNVTVNADGSFSYRATARGFQGRDSFTYQACDPSGACSGPATVTLAVG